MKIVASATIGFDHLDTLWLEKEGIKWVNAPGCNSGSVMQYITAVIFSLARKHSLDLRRLTLGIVGVGNVGTKVARAASAIGMRVLLNDPPRQRREGNSEFQPLKKLLAESDILTLHVPLTLEGEDKTLYMISGTNLPGLKRNCIIINSSRGEVVNNTALRYTLNDRLLIGAALDVWEGEPEADIRLVELVDIATPHIAGYSVDGKANATVNSVREVAATLHIPLTDWRPASLPQPPEPIIDLTHFGSDADPLDIVASAVMHTYQPEEDGLLFRSNPGKFEYLRDNYRIRREFNSFSVRTTDPKAEKILSDLGFQVIN